MITLTLKNEEGQSIAVFVVPEEQKQRVIKTCRGMEGLNSLHEEGQTPIILWM